MSTDLLHLLQSLTAITTAEVAKSNALTVARYAEQVNDKYLRAFGLEDENSIGAYAVAWYTEDDVHQDEVPDALLLLQLCRSDNLMPGVTRPRFDDPILQFALHFCPDRVECRHSQSYGEPHNNPDVPEGWKMTMTYEHAARFVICHLARQILKIIQFRPNSDLDNALDLYYQLQTLLTP